MMRRPFAMAVLALVLSLGRAVRADEEGAAVGGLSGSLRLDAWSSTRSLDERRGVSTLTLWVKGGAPLGRLLSVYAEGWAGYQDLTRSPATRGLLREAYVDLSLGPLSLRAGKQIVVWGRADAINPTDNLSPRDFTLLVPDDADQRFGTGAVKASAYAGSVAFIGIWLPDFAPYVVPIPAFPPGFTVVERRPSAGSSLAQGAARLEQTGKAVDWSLSYFDGFDRAPNLGLGGTMDNPVILLDHPRVRVLGADAATVLGRFGLRGEAAYTLTRDRRGDDPQLKNPFWRAVIGADRTFREYLNVNVQYVVQVIEHFHDPRALAEPNLRELAVQGALAANQWDQVQHGGTARISDQWLNETLEAELSGAVFGPTATYVVRGKVAYSLSDRWRVLAGFDWFDGEAPSPLRFLRKNSAAYAEVRVAL